jgi:hypothetical protein
MNINEYQDASGAIWYYDEITGLYYSSSNFCGVGYTLTQLDRFDEGNI